VTNDPCAAAAQRPQLPWHCVACEAPALLEVVDRWWITPEGDDEFEPHERAFARCLTCRMPYVLGRDADYHQEDSPLRQLWPEQEAPLPHHVPQSIRDSHDEALRCRSVQAYTGAALLARRGVEAICAEHGHRKGMLGPKLKALLDEGVIDGRLYDWSSVVQDIGNSGAHDVEEPLSGEDADDAIAFFEALVNYLYTFQRRYKQYKRRKAADDD
jgi:hypothetical protein